MGGGATSSTAGVRRFAAFLVAVAVATVLAVAGPAAPAAHADNVADAQALFALTNQTRADNGLAPLQWDSAAANIASWWSNVNASNGTLAHNPYLVSQINEQVTPYWTRIGENVGYASSISGVHNAFLNSPPHLANILGDYNRVGVGVVADGSGRLWVTLDFIKGPDLPVQAPPTLVFRSRGGADSTTGTQCTTCRPVEAVRRFDIVPPIPR
jgi:uncharacterized protein YkwD